MRNYRHEKGEVRPNSLVLTVVLSIHEATSFFTRRHINHWTAWDEVLLIINHVFIYFFQLALPRRYKRTSTQPHTHNDVLIEIEEFANKEEFGQDICAYADKRLDELDLLFLYMSEALNTTLFFAIF